MCVVVFERKLTLTWKLCADTAANKPAEAQTKQTQRQNKLFETWSNGAKADVSHKKIIFFCRNARTV